MISITLVVTLSLFLPILVILHRFGQRQAERRAGHTVPTQGIALKAVLGGILLATAGLGFAAWQLDFPPGWVLWTTLVLCGMGYCYWSLICLTESGRRYIIVELVAANPGITASQILARYNRQQIIAVRLDRLEHWGTLIRNGDRYKPRPSLMLIASVLVRSWALLLGFEWALHITPLKNKQPNQ